MTDLMTAAQVQAWTDHPVVRLARDRHPDSDPLVLLEEVRNIMLRLEAEFPGQTLREILAPQDLSEEDILNIMGEDQYRLAVAVVDYGHSCYRIAKNFDISRSWVGRCARRLRDLRGMTEPDEVAA